MSIKRFLFFVIFLQSMMVFGQRDFRPGYIINPNNDTLFGEIDYRGELLMGSVCGFRQENAKDIDFFPADIKGYRLIDSKYYISDTVNGKLVFLEVLIYGKLNIYYLRDEIGDHYFMNKEGDDLIEIPYTQKMITKEGKTYLYKSKTHIGLLSTYLNDAPDIKPQITTISKPEHNSLIKLAEKYHYEVCDTEDCLVFDKRPTKILLDLEPLIGYSYFNPDYEKNSLNNVQLGLLLHFCLPRVNEKLFFKTGIQYSIVQSGRMYDDIFKVPIQLEYQYPGKISPHIAVGLNFYNSIGSAPALNMGLNFKLTKQVYCSMNYDLDSKIKQTAEKLNLFHGIYNQSLFAGIYFRL